MIEEAGEEVEASKELGEGGESVQAPREPEIGIVAPVDMHLPNPFLCCLIITTLNVCLVYVVYWYFPFLVGVKSAFNEMFCWFIFLEKKSSFEEDEEDEEKDEDERELEKLEKGDPEMIKVCNTIMNQLDEFKVGFVFVCFVFRLGFDLNRLKSET